MTIAEAGGGVPASTESAGATRSSGRPWLRRLLSAGSLLLLFILAFIGSRGYRGQHNDPVEPTPAPANDTATKAETVGSSAELLERGDQALHQYRFAAALSLYADFLEAKPSCSAFIEYRFALCHESLGNTEKALAAYRKAIGAAPSPAFAFACQMGMARCLLRQDEPVQARRLLYPVLLDEERQQVIPADMIADARFLAALAAGREANAAKADRPVDADLAAYGDVRMEIPFYFEELAAAADAEAPAVDEKKKPATITVQRGNEKQPSIVVQAVDSGPSAVEALERLTTAGGLRAEWSDDAKRLVSERFLRLSVRNWTLHGLLETAADHLDLVCQFSDDTVRFSTRAEPDKQTLIRLNRGSRQRALHAAILLDAEGPLAPAACLELGNELAADDQLADAALWFERVTSRFPTSPLAVLGLFNRAHLHVRLKEFPLARQALLRVIDHVPGHEYSLRAYLRIGQLCLADDDLGQAVTHLRRGLTLAPASDFQPIVAMTLAAVHLQAGESAKARAVLAKHRAAVHREPHRNMATFLDVYANYRLAKSESAARREAADLLGALEAEPNAATLRFLGEWLMAQAFRDLGLLDEAERMLRQAAAHAHGPFAERITLTLAETLTKRNRRDQAAQLFAKLAQSPSPHGAHAQFELARFDFQEQRFQPCADRCRQLWTNQSVADRSAVLQLWGTALEELGEFAKASQCYAGKAPE